MFVRCLAPEELQIAAARHVPVSHGVVMVYRYTLDLGYLFDPACFSSSAGMPCRLLQRWGM